MSAINAKIESRRIFPSGGRRNALSAALICIAAGTVLSSIRALITTAVNQAERVLDKARSNFCDFFRFRQESTSAVTASSETKEKLEALFRKR